jgi:Zn-dependent protease with chaperone function
MPPYYGLCVVAGIAGIVVVLGVLACLYGFLIYIGLWPFIDGSFGKGGFTVPAAVFQTSLGITLFALTWRALRRRDARPGIEVVAGSCPALEELVAWCAARAGLTPPDAIHLTPDANIAAFSSGLVRSSGSHSNFLNLGALFVPSLSRAEWEAAIVHEFAHLVMRRELWAVNLDNRIREFVPRLRILNRRGHISALLITVSVARLVLFGYWSVFNLLMASLRRREELLADSFAAGHCGSANYAGAKIVDAGHSSLSAAPAPVSAAK